MPLHVRSVIETRVPSLQLVTSLSCKLPPEANPKVSLAEQLLRGCSAACEEENEGEGERRGEWGGVEREDFFYGDVETGKMRFARWVWAASQAELQAMDGAGLGGKKKSDLVWNDDEDVDRRVVRGRCGVGSR